MRPGLAVITGAVLLAGCGSTLDRAKREPAHKAALAVQAFILQTGGTGAQGTELHRTLDVEVSALATRVQGDKERAVLVALQAARDGFRDFLTFRGLDFDAVNGRARVAGQSLESAKRYTLTVFDEADGAGWVETASAPKYSLAAAERAMADVDRLLRQG